MRTIVAMGGEPATGKSTIVRRLLERGGEWIKWEPEKLVVCHRNDEHYINIIGDYSDPEHKFPGTDRLSMAVQPQALKWIAASQSNVFFEGDRLFNMSLLEELAEMDDQAKIRLKIIVVTADKHIKEARHVERDDTQEDQFKKSKETKTERIMSNMLLMGYINVVQNNTPEDLDRIVNEIWGYLTI